MFRWKNKQLSQLDRSKFVRNFGSYFLLLSALAAMALFGVCSPRGTRYLQQGGGGLSGSAASVQGEKISSTEFKRSYHEMYRRMQDRYGESFDPAALQLSKSVLDQLVDERLLYVNACENGFQATEDNALKVISDIKFFRDDNGKFSDKNFANYLRANGYTEATFLEEMRRRITVQNFQQFIFSTAFVSTKAAELDYKLAETKMDVEYLKFEPKSVTLTIDQGEIDKFLKEGGQNKVKEYFEKHKSEFSKPEKIHARHILVAYKGARNATADGEKRSKDEAKKRAQEILDKVKGDTKNFAELAKQMTDEPSGKTSGGDLGYFTKDAMVKEFSDVAFSLKPGEISGIVESPFGFHIINVLDKQAANSETLEQATVSIAKKLIENEKKPALLQEHADKILASLKEGKPVDSSLKDWNLSWKSTGPTSISSKYFSGLGSDKEIKEAVLSLRDTGKPYDKVISKGETKYIIRLKSKTLPDLGKLDPDKKLDLAKNSSFNMGYSMYAALKDDWHKKFDEKGKIWINPDYLDLEKPRSKTPESSAPEDASDD